MAFSNKADFWTLQADAVTRVGQDVSDEVANANTIFHLHEPTGWLDNFTCASGITREQEIARRQRRPYLGPTEVDFTEKGAAPRDVKLRAELKTLQKAAGTYFDDEEPPNKKLKLDTNKSSAAQPLRPAGQVVHDVYKQRLLEAWDIMKEGVDNIDRNTRSSRHAITERVHGVEGTDMGDGKKLELMASQRDAIGRLEYLIRKYGGGILADDMGLGKTLTMISLMARRVESARRRGEHITCLVVVPPSLIPTWRGEFKYAPALKVMYYDDEPQSARTKANLQLFDVVVVGTGVLSNLQQRLNKCRLHFQATREGFGDEFTEALKGRQTARKAKSGSKQNRAAPSLVTERQDAVLVAMEWDLFTLDEAHNIRNANGVLASILRALNARARIAVTGTPVQNGYKDFLSMLIWARITPYQDAELFKYSILSKVTKGKHLTPAKKQLNRLNDAGISSLRSAVTVRRVKGQIFDGRPIIGVMSRLEYRYWVDLSAATAETQLETRRIWDEEFRARNGRDEGDFVDEIFQPEVLKAVALAKLAVIQDDLHNARYGEYGVLELDDAAGHGLDADGPETHDGADARDYQAAAEEQVKKQHARVASADQKKERDTNRSRFRGPYERREKDWRSNRLYHVVKKIKLVLRRHREAAERLPPNERQKYLATHKILVFCEYLSALDLIAIGIFEELKMRPLRFDGSETQQKRETSRKQFEEYGKDFSQEGTMADGTTVMLVSTRAGAEGITLVHASDVFIVAPTWNPFAEEQCIARAFRKGREGDITLHRFVSQDSIERRIIFLQKVKRGKSSRIMSDEYIRKHRKRMLKWNETRFLKVMGWDRVSKAIKERKLSG
ncbi:hypothetical protein LTR56_014469 [Elasticomyces elasticus]|nr:hypothetical protein LTR56_014469 [Elasticomyces elasticus]KAK3646527.1 hypothetical protein LTR22_014290 [Elasticomyces elasticus]KAK4910446.1 hypothetical protein LTR49_020881 [Elasticomyces elasticus]KAK5755662.1 hypothetical protein LTS12_014223 [Elasticomyces elasticus]